MRSPADRMAFMLCKLTATHSKTYLGRPSQAPMEADNEKAIGGGRRSLPHRCREIAEWRWF